MNKETVYIEPEDDITDIIAKIEKSKEKIVALVPPKKAGVFRSVVNIKLIAKAAKTADKTVVLVTVDPSITKLAAASKLPVAKNLQSAPSVPEIEDEEINKEETTDVDEDGKEITPEDEAEAEAEEADDSDEDSEDEEPEEDDENEKEEKPKKPKKKKSGKKSGNRLVNWIKSHKKLSILIGILALGLIGFLIWAFGFAPAVDITVSIKTDAKNFSEGITFVDSLDKEDAKEGKIYLEQKKIETVQEVDFDATGKKNVGEKASGDVVFSRTFWKSEAYGIDSVTINGLSFVANPSTSISWDGKKFSACDNLKDIDDIDRVYGAFLDEGCKKSVTVNLVATESGEKYNVSASCGWLTLSGVSGCSGAQFSGGSDKVITVVQQSDVISAQDKIKASKEEEIKTKLFETIPDDSLIIENTFNYETNAAVATPGVDEEVKEGVKPKLKATTTATVYIIDKTKLEEYINTKADLRDDQKIIEIRDIYIDGFSEITSGASGKLKAKYYVGPRITESEVVDKIKGRGLGDAQRALRDIDGVSDVKIDKSYPWVFTIPGNTNKVKVTFEITDQNGEKIEEKKEGEENSEEGENPENPENTEENSEDKENQ